MNIFLKKYREVIAILLFVSVLVIVALFVILPFITKITDAKDKVQEALLDQEGKRQRLAQLPKIRQQFATIKDNEQSINVLLDKNNAVVLIEKLEKLGQDTGNDITISVVDSQAQNAMQAKGKNDNAIINNLPNQNYLALTLKLNGSFNSIARFIDSLDTFEYYSDITSIDMKQHIESEKPAQVSSGILDPFNLHAENQKAPVQKIAKNSIDTSLNVVFYLK